MSDWEDSVWIARLQVQSEEYTMAATEPARSGNQGAAFHAPTNGMNLCHFLAFVVSDTDWVSA